MRRLSLAILVLALVLGAALRFSGLDRREMSADEGASWAAAIAPTFSDVLQIQPRQNPGEFGVHDLALHAWIRWLGDGVGAMRSLSALFGTLAIILVYPVAQEILQIDAGNKRIASDFGGEAAEISHKGEIDHPAACAALVFAANLVTIKYSQEARMYTLALALSLAQVWLFLRVMRRATILDCVGVALLTTLSISASLTVCVILLPEGLWLLYVLWRRGAAEFPRVFAVVIALAAGMLLLVPIGLHYYRARGGAPNMNVYNWIAAPRPWAPISLFNKATGTFAFPPMAALAAWAMITRRRESRDALIFTLLWMFAAPILLLLVSYAVRPAFVERYMLSCFVPFFILVGLGAWSFTASWQRGAALALIVTLALGHVAEFNRRPHDVQWREATVLAAGQLDDSGSIAVAPPYAVSVVRYYLDRIPGPARPARIVGFETPATLIIVADAGVRSPEASKLARAYPRVLAHVRGLVVRGR